MMGRASVLAGYEANQVITNSTRMSKQAFYASFTVMPLML